MTAKQEVVVKKYSKNNPLKTKNETLFKNNFLIFSINSTIFM